jgi:SAM-dependent methyltransferase
LKGKKVKLLYADLMQKLPFKSGMFDKIIMSEVAEHLPNDLKGFSEVKRVLKKGGTLLVTVPNQNYPFLWDPVNWIAERLFKTHIRSGFWAGLWNQHLRLYKPDDIKKIIKKAGYKVGEVSSLTWWCLPFNHYLVNLTARAIHSGKLDPDIKALVNKYEMKIKRPLLLDLAFFVAQTVDMLNDIFPVKKSGVGVFVSAEKP